MKEKKDVIRLLCRISDLLDTTNEQQAAINFALQTNLIYGQKLQIDIEQNELKYTAITFAEQGLGVLVANSAKSEKPRTDVTVQ